MDNQSLKGKIALVTGASYGIGRAIAVAYGRAGAAVSCAARSLDKLQDTIKEIVEVGGQGLAVQTDVTDWEAAQRMVKATVDQFGGLDIVVINAGNNFDRRLVQESIPEDWRATIDLNLTGAYYCAKAAIPYLKQNGGGKIIMMGSGARLHGRAGNSAYACSKAALWMLTRSLAQELWPDNITVNELIPGPVRTPLTADVSFDRFESEWVKTPEDVAPLALFMATQPDTGPTAQSYSLMRRDP